MVSEGRAKKIQKIRKIQKKRTPPPSELDDGAASFEGSPSDVDTGSGILSISPNSGVTPGGIQQESASLSKLLSGGAVESEYYLKFVVRGGLRQKKKSKLSCIPIPNFPPSNYRNP